MPATNSPGVVLHLGREQGEPVPRGLHLPKQTQAGLLPEGRPCFSLASHKQSRAFLPGKPHVARDRLSDRQAPGRAAFSEQHPESLVKVALDAAMGARMSTMEVRPLPMRWHLRLSQMPLEEVAGAPSPLLRLLPLPSAVSASLDSPRQGHCLAVLAVAAAEQPMLQYQPLLQERAVAAEGHQNRHAAMVVVVEGAPHCWVPLRAPQRKERGS
mmetsp:Transcript_31093/g.81712  ORF Transcript_31093/g.81712 Transcript_31093/m.81712 type:complete len:213 (+) Transcript_31093:603-1241(+)